jgi:hypothetical protein
MRGLQAYRWALSMLVVPNSGREQMKRRPVVVDGENYDTLSDFLATIGISEKTSRKDYDAAYFKMKSGKPFVYAGRKYLILKEQKAKAEKSPRNEPHALLRKPQTMGLHQDKGEHW